MTRSPTFSPAGETPTPPQNFGPAAPRPSPPGPMSPGSSWLHNHAYRRASLSTTRLLTRGRCQVDGAAETVLRRSCQETLRVARSQLQGTDPVAALIKKTTGQNLTNHVLEDPRIRKLDA